MFLGLRTVKYDVADIAKAKEWYTKVFGVEPYFDQPAFYVGYNIVYTISCYISGLLADHFPSDGCWPAAMRWRLFRLPFSSSPAHH